MNYIGSKNKLSNWIKTVISSEVSEQLETLAFCDLFAGTGIIGLKFKPEVKKVIANDVEFYSYVLLKNYIENNQEIPNSETYLEKLNQLPGKKGFIFQEYGENGSADRLFFSETNAQKIDACRQQIKTWKTSGEIDGPLYFFLLASLLESADKVANTASVYGAFLKKIKTSAAKIMVVAPARTAQDLFNEPLLEQKNQVFQKDANQLIKEINGDILYLDPPYNARQYGANYHLLNTIAVYSKFSPRGKTGLPDYYKSTYCKKNQVADEFENLIKNAEFSTIFLSYNNEGLMPPETIKTILKKYGDYHLETTAYQRFKADKTENRNHTASETTEYLHCLKK